MDKVLQSYPWLPVAWLSINHRLPYLPLLNTILSRVASTRSQFTTDEISTLHLPRTYSKAEFLRRHESNNLIGFGQKAKNPVPDPTAYHDVINLSLSAVASFNNGELPSGMHRERNKFKKLAISSFKVPIDFALRMSSSPIFLWGSRNELEYCYSNCTVYLTKDINEGLREERISNLSVNRVLARVDVFECWTPQCKSGLFTCQGLSYATCPLAILH